VTAELLAGAKNDFRLDPLRAGPALEEIIASRSLLEKNVNPQAVLDVLFLKLYRNSRRTGARQMDIFNA
jgi:hypothetical protein